MSSKKLLILYFVLTLSGGLIIFVKLSYFIWQSKSDYLMDVGIGLLALAGLLALYTCILTSINLYTTLKFEWTWVVSTFLTILNIAVFAYYFNS